MVALTFLVSSLLVASQTWASPLPVIGQFLCPRSGSGTNTVAVNTHIGTAHGTRDVLGANRFPVRYASANRWAQSTVATTWSLPSGATTAAGLPLACPQPGLDDSQVSEDCLSMILYVPTTLTPTSNAPTLMWIHGGSFIQGSATAAGLDGSNLAIATGSIVAVMQYRLGALGFLPPDGSSNLAVQDVMNALQFLQNNVPSFGGSASKITIAGQSSGATMIRALLAVPSASSLFQSAILQSDPMDFGLLSTTTQTALQSYLNSQLTCASSDVSCLDALPLDTVLAASLNTFLAAASIDASAGAFSPMRPVHDGTLITSPLDSTAPFPAQNKPIIISTVLNEAGPAIYGNFTDPLDENQWVPTVNATFGTPRTNTIVSSSFYPAPVMPNGLAPDARIQLQTLGTDYLWKCAGWTFARSWVQSGGKAYTGMYTVGATYPGNDQVPFCTEKGSVCHQDDIEIVFGTTPSPNFAQATLTTEMQKRYKAFLNSGNPNAGGCASWPAATSSNVNAIQLGSSGTAPINACEQSFWGQAVQYDYQFFGI